MPPFPFNIFSPFSQTIGRFLYDPVTNWQGAFSPSIVFNANPQDGPIEAHVLAQVGSYGKQLGILIHAVDVLQSQLDRGRLDEAQTQALEAFDSLRDQATAAAHDFRSGVNADQILALAKSFRDHHGALESKTLREGIDQVLGA